MAYTLEYNNVVYTKENYKSLKTLRSKSMISEDCTINTLSALIRSDDLPELYLRTLYGENYAPMGYDAFVIETGSDIRDYTVFSPVLLRRDNAIIGKYFLTSIKRENNNWFTLEACSSIGILDKTQHLGGLYAQVSFSAILAEIMGDIPYSLTDTKLASSPISGWLPMATARQNLESLLFAVGAAATYNESGDLVFKFNEPDVSYQLSDDFIYRGGDNVNYPTKANKVTIVEHAWFKDDTVAADVLYDNTEGTVADNALISFDEPCHTLLWTGTSMTPVNCNCCYVTGSGTLTGKKYAHTKRELTREDSTITGGEIRVEDATLISSINSLNALKRIYNYYHNADEISYTVRSDGHFKCGDLLTFKDPFDDEDTFGYVKEMNDNVSRSVKSQVKIITNWQPTALGNTYEHSMIVKTSDLVGGTWTVPSAMRGNPALVVLFAGFGGGQGGYNGTDGEDKWYSYPNFKGYDKYLPSPGVGGSAGVAGGYPKYIVGEYEALEDSYSVSFGAGGNGGASNGGAGQEGGHSVFGQFDTDQGSVLSGEYVNLLDGSIVASKGNNGFAGGNGGATRPYNQSGSVILTEIAGRRRWKRYSDIGYNGSSVGVYQGGSGCHGGSVEDNYEDDNSKFYEGPGSGGGGAAFGANGGNANENWREPAITPKQGGNGANAVAPADAVLGKTGAGGNGGGGGGAGGIALGYVRGDYNDIGNSPGDGGSGSIGGKGSDGFALIYY